MEPDRLTYVYTQKEIDEKHCLMQDMMEENIDYYVSDLAPVILAIIVEINAKSTVEGLNFYQQYILKQGLKIFSDPGREAMKKEIGQLHACACFTSIDISEMTDEEKRKVVEALMFLCQKHD